MKARIIAEDGRIVEGILVTPKNARIVNAFQPVVLNESTNRYFTYVEAVTLLAYVLKLLEEPEEPEETVESGESEEFAENPANMLF